MNCSPSNWSVLAELRSIFGQKPITYWSTKGEPDGKPYGHLVPCPKIHPNSPDLVGEVEINGRTYKLAAWIRVGHQGKYLDLVGSDIATGGLN